jgi:AcrR family transcriptional regulator
VVAVRDARDVGLGRSPSIRPDTYAKSTQTQAQILAAALGEASDHGLHRTSMSRIAERANVAVGSLSYHFGSRAELLRAMMKKLMADLFERLAFVDDHDHIDFFERHRRELLVYLQYLRANPAHIRLTDEIKFLEPELYKLGVGEWVGHLSTKLRAGVEEGSLRSMEEWEIVAQAHFLLGARHFLEEMIDDDIRRDEQVVDVYLGLVRGGLASPDGVHVPGAPLRLGSRGGVAP